MRQMCTITAMTKKIPRAFGSGDWDWLYTYYMC